MCDLVNHTHFPKEDHLPDWAHRDYQVKKGDRVQLTQHEKSSVYTWGGLTTSCKSTVIAKVRNKETKW